jgi:hypothetical protein
MIPFSYCASTLRLKAAILSGLIAGLVLVSRASAVTLDFNVPSGNFITASNWLDTTAAPVPAAAAPTVNDTAYVRNSGTVTINSNVGAKELRIGASNQITNPDYDNNGVVDANDYVLWRKGGPIQNDATTADVGPDDYIWWRYRFGGTPLVQDIGGPGTLMWTAGEITGLETENPVVAGVFTGGPVLRVGRHVNVDATHANELEFTGTVIQNGPTTKIMLSHPESKLNIGDDGSTPNPTSSYTLVSGTIGTAVTASGLDGANGNNGINVRNGTFTMTGGHIIDATPAALGSVLSAQRFITVSSGTGTGTVGSGNENVATATFTGGDVDSNGGLRVAAGANSIGYLNINGPVTIITGGDTIIGEHRTGPSGAEIGDAYGEMNMSAGTLQVGRTTDTNGNASTALAGRFQVGRRAKGVLNMSGGTIIANTSDLRVGAEYQAGGSLINMTGGTITTIGLNIRNGAKGAGQAFADDGASVILNGPNAVFSQIGSPGTIIGNHGKGLFEVRQGTATLGDGGSAAFPVGNVNVGRSSDSEATLNLKGGKLIIAGTLDVSSTTPPLVAPVIGLTGGTLEIHNPWSTAAQSWRPNFTNAGSNLILSKNALRQVAVGSTSPVFASDFAMTSGSWEIDLGSNTVLGADWFNVQNGAASLTGGTLNINYLSGFTPNAGQVFRILRAANGTTLGSVTIAGNSSGGGHWELQEAPISNVNFPLDEEIQLKYVVPGAGSGGGLGTSAVPEPTSAVLVVFAAAGLLTRRRPRSRSRAKRNQSIAQTR